MAIRMRPVDYDVDEHQFEGQLFWDDSIAGSRPGVLVAHTIRGRTEFEEDRARRLAEMGYCAMALDVYGRDQIGNLDASRANMDALKADRSGLQRRLQAALAAISVQSECDATRLAAIGYCFGGLCVLDLARQDAALQGVVSFHGLFTPLPDLLVKRSTVRVLALHGWDDPLAPPEEVVEFAAEMTALDVDWQLHAYGHAMHAFTYPAATDAERGTLYQPQADRRSWLAMTHFLNELFAPN